MLFLGHGDNYETLRSHHDSILELMRYGISLEGLEKLARKYSMRSCPLTSWSIASIRKTVNRSLAAGHAVIIGSEPHVHWICLGGRTEDGGYVWADSADDPAVGAFGSWDEVEEWMTGDCDNDEGQRSPLKYPFEILTIAPGPKMPASRTMVPWVGTLWQRFADDPDYAEDWGNLLADMLDVFWDRDYAPRGIPSGEFLAEHLDGIVEATSGLWGFGESDLTDIADGYRDAADFHNLALLRGKEAAVIAAFAHKLAAKARSRL